MTNRGGSSGCEPGQNASAGALAFQELARIAYSEVNPSESKLQDLFKRNVLSGAATLLKRQGDFPILCRTIVEIGDDAVKKMTGEIETEVTEALRRLQKLQKRTSSSSSEGATQGLAVLHAVALLQLFSDPGPDALDVLSDIKKCYKKLHDANSGDETDLSEILVEVLLSMLAASSSLTRQTSLQVFEAFSSYISSSALSFLTEILTAKENAEGSRILFSNEDEDELLDDDDDDVEQITEMELHGEATLDNGTSSNADSANSSSEDEDSSDEDEFDESGEKDTIRGGQEANDLEAALMKTFHVSHTLDKDKDAEESEDDADMSDSEMMALDDQLASHMKLLKESKGDKKQKRDAKKKVIEFKHRVLDLLAIYVKKEATKANPLLFTLFVPLLQLIRSTKEAPLSQKAIRIILETQKLLKKTRAQGETMDLDVDEAITQLEAVHDAANDPTESKTIAVAVSSASLAIATALVANEKGNFGRVADVYVKSMKRGLEGEIVVRSSLFTDWTNWYQGLAVNAKAS